MTAASRTRDDAPAFQTANRTGLHDLDLVANLGLVLLVVNVHDGLAIDHLVITRVWRLVRNGHFDRFVARGGW